MIFIFYVVDENGDKKIVFIFVIEYRFFFEELFKRKCVWFLRFK